MWGEKGRAACPAASFRMSWAELGPCRRQTPKAWPGRGAPPQTPRNHLGLAVPESSCVGFLGLR